MRCHEQPVGVIVVVNRTNQHKNATTSMVRRWIRQLTYEQETSGPWINPCKNINLCFQFLFYKVVSRHAGNTPGHYVAHIMHYACRNNLMRYEVYRFAQEDAIKMKFKIRCWITIPPMYSRSKDLHLSRSSWIVRQSVPGETQTQRDDVRCDERVHDESWSDNNRNRFCWIYAIPPFYPGPFDHMNGCFCVSFLRERLPIPGDCLPSFI